jgi:hypothetical protein
VYYVSNDNVSSLLSLSVVFVEDFKDDLSTVSSILGLLFLVSHECIFSSIEIIMLFL